MNQIKNQNPQIMNPLQSNRSDQNNITIEYLEESFPDYEEIQLWKGSFSGDRFLTWIKEKFIEFEDEGVQNDKDIFFFQNESTFAFRVTVDVMEVNPYHLWNYWKDQIIETGYVLKNSESIYKEKLTTLRYYLKPKLKFKVLGEQLFGNITVELIKNQGQPKYLMFKCTWYKDYNFKEPEHFKTLLDILTV